MKTQKAILLNHDSLSVENKKIGRILDFFGVPKRASTTAEFLADNSAGRKSSQDCRLICSSGTFLRLIEDFERDAGWMQPWEEQVHSAFVYMGDGSEILQKLVRKLTGDNGAVICKINPSDRDIVVSDDLDDFCGVMSSLRVTTSQATANGNFVLKATKGNLISIVSRGEGETFSKLDYKGVPVFLSTSGEITDIDAELESQNFDVRKRFLSAVPLVLYVKWAFAESCWSAPETNACLVIDDPLLRSRHGFVNFQELLSLMKRHKFSTNIAFIPWNWRRSAPEVARLFKENPQNYSVSVHGCHHTRAEFSGSNRKRLYWKTQQALEWMNRHESITEIRHDRVMVFPQGIFSEAALNALKRTDLIAAVNNDIISADPHPRAITLSDVWDVAVMRYSFPVFTRRYPWEGIENFAFDALLGKPAIIVIHHDYCSDHCSRLIEFIEHLNALKTTLTWRSLGEVVRRSFRQRELPSGEAEIEMYAAELRIENRSEQPKRLFVRRRECEASAIREVSAGPAPIAWNSVNGYVNFEVELRSGESKIVSVKFHELALNGGYEDNLPYRFKAMLRRYLCEIRDNYIVTSKHRLLNLFDGSSSEDSKRIKSS
jgi:peptidoglycan/xylan/chitin deacetylase (PgdA/CDA1 family)